jgi:hypothetical protein
MKRREFITAERQTVWSPAGGGARRGGRLARRQARGRTPARLRLGGVALSQRRGPRR